MLTESLSWAVYNEADMRETVKKYINDVERVDTMSRHDIREAVTVLCRDEKERHKSNVQRGS